MIVDVARVADRVPRCPPRALPRPAARAESAARAGSLPGRVARHRARDRRRRRGQRTAADRRRGRWLRIRTLNSVRADAGLAVGRPGFAADRTAVADGCAGAWRRMVDRWSKEAVAVLESADYREFLTALDALPKAWQRTLERQEAAARTAAADAAALLARLDQAAGTFSAARRAWDAIHADLEGGLSVATRAYLHAIAITPAAAGGPGRLRSDLDDLSRGEPELRIPVVAPMKAGKSTLLSALLGLDIAPRRAQIMTAVPTRFIPVPPARQAEPRLELPEPVVTGHRRLLDAIAATITDDRLASLAGHPHLQSAASRAPARRPGSRHRLAHRRARDQIRADLAARHRAAGHRAAAARRADRRHRGLAARGHRAGARRADIRAAGPDRRSRPG